jgi:hypothetical protein
VTAARSFAWVAFAWGVLCTPFCFYIAFAWGAPFIAVSGLIGLLVMGVLVWTIYQHWILISIPLAVVAIPISGAGLNPAIVFAPALLLIILASLIDLFEVQRAKLSHNAGGHV